MPMHASFVAKKLRLDLTISGDLDASISQDIRAICNSVPNGLIACNIELGDIDRVSDSGVALLQLLHRKLVEHEIIVVLHRGSPEIRERIKATALRPLPLFSREGSASAAY